MTRVLILTENDLIDKTRDIDIHNIKYERFSDIGVSSVCVLIKDGMYYVIKNMRTGKTELTFESLEEIIFESLEEKISKQTYLEQQKNKKEEDRVVKLSEFLKENKCYEQFINNFDKDFRYESWKEHLSAAIYSAFYGKDPHGDPKYWTKIAVKWNDIKNKENDMIDFFEEDTGK